MRNFITGYLKFVGFQTLSREVLKGVIRSKPKLHAQYIAHMNRQIDLEMDLYERMHKKTPTRATEPEKTDPA